MPTRPCSTLFSTLEEKTSSRSDGKATDTAVTSILVTDTATASAQVRTAATPIPAKDTAVTPTPVAGTAAEPKNQSMLLSIYASVKKKKQTKETACIVKQDEAGPSQVVEQETEPDVTS